MSFTAYIIADDSDVQAKVMKQDGNIKQLDKNLETHQHKLHTYFQWATHMVMLWSNYASQILEGTAAGAKLESLIAGIQIASAEASIAMTVQRGLSDIGQGRIAAGYFQLALAASMQYINLEMYRIRRQADLLAKEAERTRQFFDQYNADR
jgi:hypothetical protein